MGGREKDVPQPSKDAVLKGKRECGERGGEGRRDVAEGLKGRGAFAGRKREGL